MISSSSPSKAIRQRQLRVFISSTFRDMNDERDALVARAFPQLRELCRKRGVDFVPLDLRWGITENAMKEGRVLETCLREVDESRPFFIGLIGDRYGSIPEITDLGGRYQSLCRKYTWLSEAIKERMSYTEMEMQYAILLNNNKELMNAAFYFKSENSKSTTNPNERETIDEERQKLIKLKNKIRKQSIFPVKEYNSTHLLADLVLQDLKAFLEKEFPYAENQSYDSTFREQEYILSNMTQSLFSLDKYVLPWERWMRDYGKKMLSVRGDNGVGKSHILAYFVSLLRNNGCVAVYINWPTFRNLDDAAEYIVQELLNALGVRNRKQSERSNTLGCLFSFLGHSLKFIFLSALVLVRFALGNQEKAQKSFNKIFQGYNEKIATSQLKDSLQLLIKELNKRNKDRPLYIALDDIDTMTNNDLGVLNLLNNLPQIRCVCSSTVGVKANVHLESVINAEILRVNSLNQGEIHSFVTNYLALFGKELDKERSQCQRIANSPVASNPLLLSYILNMMVCFGSYEELDCYIEKLSNVNNESEVFSLYIENIIIQFSGVQRQLAAFSLIATALISEGVSEEELKRIFGMESCPLDWAIVRPYVLGLCKNKGKLYYIHSKQLCEVIFEKLVDFKKDAVDRIINYYESLLDVCLPHKDFAGTPDLYECQEDNKKLLRQAKVLPALYLKTNKMNSLYLWATYIRADATFSESERVTYWKALYDENYTMRKAPHPDLSPHVKRLPYAILDPDSPYLDLFYKESILITTREEKNEMYFRWNKIAGLFNKTEDIIWLGQKHKDSANKEINEEMNLITKVQVLYSQKNFDDIIKICLNGKFDSFTQTYLDLFLCMAYQSKCEFDKALNVIERAINEIRNNKEFNNPSFISHICLYAKLSCKLKKQENIDNSLKLLEFHYGKIIPTGVDKQEAYLLLDALTLLYLEKKQFNNAIKTGRLLEESAKSMNIPIDYAKSLVKRAIAEESLTLFSK